MLETFYWQGYNKIFATLQVTQLKMKCFTLIDNSNPLQRFKWASMDAVVMFEDLLTEGGW